jgi:hypothetical protein
MKKVAIHQPDFFPWLGFFNKLYKSDLFVINDYGQWPKDGVSYSCRVQLLVANSPKWVNMPVVHNYHGFRSYKETEIDNRQKWRQKFMNTLQMNYARAPFYKEIRDFVSPLVDYQSDYLVDYNMNALKAFIDKLNLDFSKIFIGSQLEDMEGVKTDRIIKVVKAVNGTCYLCGGGATYQKDDEIFDSGLDLEYQNFSHPNYSQFNTKEFIPGLSVIDCLMNQGFEKTEELIKRPQ